MVSESDRKSWLVSLLVTALLVGPGVARCRAEGWFGRKSPSQASKRGMISKEELRDALGQFEDYFEGTVKQAASTIDDHQPDAKTRKSTLLWKTRMIPAIHTALKQDDPIKAFVEAWIVSLRMTQFFETGAGRELFGPQQAVATAACKQIEAEIEHVGELFLSADKLDKARQEATTFATAHPIREGFAGAFVRSTTPREGAPDPFAAILTIPLEPFRAVGGIDRTAAAINRFTDVADRFTDVVEELPESTAWEMQLMLLDIEEHELIKRTLEAVEGFSRTAADFADIVRTLPDQLHFEGTRLLDEIDSRQVTLQVTLNQAENTATIVKNAVEKVNDVVESIDRAAKSVTETGHSVRDAARAIMETYDDIEGNTTTQPAGPITTTQAGSPSSSTFDINDYRKTADSMTVMANEVRQVTIEIRKLIQSQELSKQISDADAHFRGAVDQTSQRARDVTDHLAWRAAQLILLVFGLAVAYRLLIVRWAPKPKQP